MNKRFKSNNLHNNVTSSWLQKSLYQDIQKKWWKRFLLRIFISRIFSKIISFYLKSIFSRFHVKKIIVKNHIDTSLFHPSSFKSYNDFFVRTYKKINFDNSVSAFISPGEGQMCIFNINANSIFNIKNTPYHLRDLLKNDYLAEKYLNGFLVMLRLQVFDYHRYIFVDEGVQSKNNVKIQGRLHTVNPIAFKYFNVFSENSREYTILKTLNFGEIIQIEVGALLVGKINNHSIISFKKGQEKGFFSFGGSVIVLVIEPNKIKFNHLILNNSLIGIETKVNIGETIGFKLKQ
ncbi:MAG: phosphatidylserine decarboxylase [Candidatus Phytoplasma australasiaticum]|nr:phosphatidylserine decarboxylase [Candidatus Phytoplasma australasiaticum]MDV3153514.1 phosphatidylserine decarboxylase [Candidatus Phytoplasma australasiaticum]MDV3167361.1 phosphatidylserine decarboxylase [Candidatus Phytoplasma australasiaticum]MDV3180719.1 phosphatidylserine decarboxylase [Candidatus Phytoplasma australasiaticum]MDV3182882.1 phosphatidylserine decarboxylase [Candidatus Phytoplasma australasiaticum]